MTYNLVILIFNTSFQRIDVSFSIAYGNAQMLGCWLNSTGEGRNDSN